MSLFDTPTIPVPAQSSSQFRVFYKYSACILISTPDIKVLCDPWFGDDAYYGTWERYPKHELTRGFIGEFDAIWISHIHPDHYCPATLSKLFNIFGPKPIYIADWAPNKNYLQLKLSGDGFADNIQLLDSIQVGNTVLKCIPNSTGSLSDIDSSLIVTDLPSKRSVLNFNDCVNSPCYSNLINTYLSANSFEVVLFCLGYTGAGPYPQTYYSPIEDHAKLAELAQNKKEQFFQRYISTVDMIPSQFRLPFAGKYLLSGDLAFLNQYRGVADALEIHSIDSSAVVLDDSGSAFFDITTLQASQVRTEKYPEPTSLHKKLFAWQKWISFEPELTLLRRLLVQAVLRAHSKSECKEDFIWSFHVFIDNADLFDVAERPYNYSLPLLSVNCNHFSQPFQECLNPVIKSDLFISRKALFAVLTGLCHWNNYEVGSVFFVRRIPDVFSREMQSFLNFCSVC